MAVTLSISITQNSQSTANNTSSVTVKATAKWTNGSYNRTGECTGSITIDGTKYSFSGLTFNDSKTTSGSKVVMSKTVNVSHDSDGTKKLSCSASFVTGVNSGTISASASKDLTTIPRKSTLTVANGTLGTAQTLTITEQASTFKHKLKYTCGDASGWVLGGDSSFSTSNSVSWTPPLSLAQQNTTGTSVSVTFTLYTYTDAGSSVGNNSYTKTFSIPSSVKPSVSVAVSDPMGYANAYGAYIQGLSKLKIVATASGSQGSTIKSYKTEADGKTYTTATVETGVVAGTGTLTIKVTVTDSRGRTATGSATVSSLAYAFPKISAMSVYRCDASGNAGASGAYLAVKFSSVITSLNSKNTATYTVKYKKSSATTYTTKTLSDFAGKYTVTNGVYVFSAETASSYDVALTVKDAFKSVDKPATGSSVKKVWSLLKKAGEIVGYAIGKVAELEGVLDIAVPVKFREGIIQNVLWSGGFYMNAEQTITLSEAISKQPTGIVLIFSRYDVTGNAVMNEHFSYHFVPKTMIELHPGKGSIFNMSTSNETYSSSKYLYISDTQITGHANNTQIGTGTTGVNYNNNRFVLRYVIGV